GLALDLWDAAGIEQTSLPQTRSVSQRSRHVDLTALRNANPDHWSKATAIRALTLDAVHAANSGHSGMPIGMADVATVLFEKHLKFDAAAPEWPDRDRFILSAGHGSMLLYSLLYLTGSTEITLDEIKNFRQWGAKTAGHPENFLASGIETTTGPLGQGIANSVGFAIAEEAQRARFGKKVVDHHTYVIAGDGCLMEGISHEAIGLAGRLQLGKLIVLWDNNNITIDGKVELSDCTNQVARFKAAGWQVIEIDGHDPAAIDEALTAAKKTRKPSMIACKTHDRKGRYIYYGIREHGMAAAMNGMALHGGIRPYGGTFMCFTDYARPAMRLAALMKIPSVFVMTHDSIGLGEDGPTHQPVEHLAISRATPNTHVFRPADTVETAEAWELALTSKTTPSVLSLTRQGLPTVRTEHKQKNLTAQGAYVLADAEGKRQVILIATGSEIAVAMEARDILQAEGIGTRVVSMPCMELFAEQDEAYRKRVLPAGPVRVGIEAAVRQGWDRWLLGERGRDAKAGFIGMDSFGASAPAEELFEKFGITAKATVAKVKDLLG
ncbi:UNVERIFIED_CONTAM: hypothetical protein GTU68_021331, partial [Idotea baltica]|nr:hypothetical protein [Idotea baltica]